MSISDIFQKFSYYLTFPFVRHAIIVGILIAFCSALLGVTLVLKRYSFIGDGLSHVAFGSMAIATVIKLTNIYYLVMPITIVAAVLMLCASNNAKVKGDAVIAILSSGALAFGYLVMNVFGASANVSGDVCTTLFGSISILTLSSGKVWFCLVVCLLVSVVYFLMYNRIFAVTFDENFMAAMGVNVKLYNLVYAIITAVIIVLAMDLVGSLLITALLVIPSLTAMRVMKSFKAVVIYSALISVVGAFVGMFIAIVSPTFPVGSTIVMVDLIIFIVHCIIKRFIKN